MLRQNGLALPGSNHKSAHGRPKHCGRKGLPYKAAITTGAWAAYILRRNGFALPGNNQKVRMGSIDIAAERPCLTQRQEKKKKKKKKKKFAWAA
jgi:hypothetical protein